MSTLFLLAGALLCLWAWLYLKWSKLTRYWAERNVPYLPPHPVLGSLTFLQRVNPALWLIQMHHHFKAPYYGIWLFWRPALVVSSPELAKNILVKDAAVFRDRFLSSGSTDPIGSLNLFTVNDPVWSNVRRRMTTFFTGAKLRALQVRTRIKASELVQRIKQEGEKKINLRLLYTDYTTDVFGTSAFGVESNATLTGGGPLREITSEFSKFTIFRGLSWCSIFFFPELVDIFRFKLFPASSTDYFKKSFKSIMKQREEFTKGSEESKDIVDVLLRLKKEGDVNGKGFSDDFLVSQAAIMLLGGFDTSSSVLSYITYELAFQPEMQEKLYEELLEAVKNNNGSADFNIQQLAELPYLNAIFKETLRKYPPMGWLDRVARFDYKMDDKLTIKAGTPVYVNSVGMQYDDEYFPEPQKFDPDRFLPENEKNIKPYTYLPFGDGPRVCIGQRFAHMSVRTAMSLIFLNYKVRAPPGSPKPCETKLEARGLFMMPGEPLYVEYVPREVSKNL